MSHSLAELESSAAAALKGLNGRRHASHSPEGINEGFKTLQTVLTTTPKGKANAGIERGPVLQTAKLSGGQDVVVVYGGQSTRYRLAMPVFTTPDGALVLVRINRANPTEAEVYRMDITNHAYLGTARRA